CAREGYTDSYWYFDLW
nr:immunoglobulin heavy chain junction region [Macaca mulatta]MOW45520.1 immunoglobulin heavy chain junction region [Macaca mulatta]MOW45779.1 immunoglobulin heavy chain junction region [Macaca mulatta]MOW45789.1 immunoglobulin heavy chain junction region [Macaca mulatta]MOW45818.1 immunoglobulin heavy chain junction region [Macaca mulatta]